MFYLDSIISILGLLLSIAFFTLVERKVMGLSHYRKGPNKVIWSGVSQPIADALKLLTKENIKMPTSKLVMYIMGPTTALLLMLTGWLWFDFLFNEVSGSLKILLIVSSMGLVSYSLLLMSWGSNSKYSIIGGHRALSQVLSYDVCLFLFIAVSASLGLSLEFKMFKATQEGLWLAVLSVPCFFFWVALCMAESNRTPFDLAEGESELVSGFNIEYGGGLFAVIFVSEYGMILLMSFLSSLLFLGGGELLKTFMFCMIYIWTRVALPRVRYDKLMNFSWKVLLPYSVVLLLMVSLSS